MHPSMTIKLLPERSLDDEGDSSCDHWVVECESFQAKLKATKKTKNARDDDISSDENNKSNMNGNNNMKSFNNKSTRIGAVMAAFARSDVACC